MRGSPSSHDIRASPADRRAVRLGWALALSLLVVHLVGYLAYAAALVAFPFDYDQGEGYDVNAAWLLAQGQWIYRDNDLPPYYSSNYPPLYPLVLAPFVAVWG
ncbi:MAG TPA: hypothetical protein VIN09_14400, partial [Chloroflexota bacterium]